MAVDLPKLRVIVLEGFVLGHGRAAASPGDDLELDQPLAERAIELGQARLPGPDDHAPPHVPTSRDPNPINRDPIPKRR